MNKEKRIIKFFSLMLMAMLFSVTLMVQTTYAEEIDFSEYSTTYGYEQLAEFGDGDNRQELYTLMYQRYEALWNSDVDYSTEIGDGTGHYVLDNLPIDTYEYEASDVMEVYLALQFDNPLLYYMPTTFYTASYVEEGRENIVAYVQLAVDADYNEASERAALNNEVLAGVEEYKQVVSSLDTDYEKVTKIHDMLIESMYYSYDEEGNPSTDAWAHNVVGALIEGKGVCESYAKTFQLVMNYVGLESYIVTGVSNNENHAWNLVKMDDGYYYYIDCTWDDTSDAGTKDYFLKGIFEFDTNHEKNLPTGEGGNYLYALPQAQMDNYEKLIEMSYNGGATVKYGVIKAAFEAMTDANGSYVITIPDERSVYLPSGQWPTVKKITIIGNDTWSYFTYATGDVILNSDVVIKDTTLATASSVFIEKLGIAKFDINNYAFTLENTSTGGYSFYWNEAWGEYPEVSGPGIHITGEEGSTLTFLDSVQMRIEGDSIDVDNLIVDGAYVTVMDCNITANKLIFRDSKGADIIPDLYLSSMLAATKGMDIDIKETIIDGISGVLTSHGVYKGTKISLGNISGDDDLSIAVTCDEEDAYPSIAIDNSLVDIYFRISNSTTRKSGEQYYYKIWDGALEYTGPFINIGNTSMDKIANVICTLYKSNGLEEPIEVISKSDLEILFDIDDDGNLYRRYNDRMNIINGVLYNYVYFDVDKCPTSITIPNDVKRIGIGAFWGCSNLNSIIIPEGVNQICARAFVDCGLTEITLPSTIEWDIDECALGYTYDSKTGTYSKVDGFKIYCYNKYPSAITYATNNGFDYELLDLPVISGLSASKCGTDNITLSWAEDEIADGYIIKKEIGTEWVKIADITDAEYKATGLEPVTEYEFEVSAYKINDNGDYVLSKPQYVYAKTVPTKVTGLALDSRDSNSITLKWDKNIYAQGYIIEQYIDGAWVQKGTSPHPNTVTFKVAGLEKDTTYKFRVAAYKGSLVGEYAYYDAKTQPNAPEDIIKFECSKATTNTLTLTWNENADADGYEISYCNEQGEWVVIATITDNTKTSFVVDSLEAYTTYSFRIRAYLIDDLGTCVYSYYKNLNATTALMPITGFSNKNSTGDTITLGWNVYEYPDNVSGIIIECWNSESETYNVITYLGASASEWVCQYLNPETTYKYRICVYTYNNSGYEVRSEYVYIEAATTKVAPQPVAGFGYSDRTSDSVTLTWTANSYADGYEIEVNRGEEWVNVATLTGEKSSYKVTGLTPFTKYSFRIRAFKNDGNNVLYGDYTVWNVETLIGGVTNLVCSNRTQDSITLKWNPASHVTGYEIEQYINGSWVCVWSVTSSVEDTGVIVGLTPDTLYEFRVRAYNNENDWVFSDYTYINASTMTETPDLPDPVASFTYSARNNNSITLKWAANSSVDGYVIEQYKGGKWTIIKTIESNATTSYKVTGLSASTKYQFRIRAYNKDETSTSYGAYASKTIMTFPNAVTGFSYSGRTATDITLKWTKNTSASGYVIEQYKGGKWTAVKTIESNSKVSHKITGLSSGTAHQFRIRAYKLDGTTKVYSSYTNKTVKTLPSTVKNFTVKTRTATTITLKWTKNTSADGYVIQQYKGGKWVTIKTITKNSTLSYKVTGLSPSKTYKFRIRAYKNDGSNKLYSASYTTKSVQTLPSTVKGFTYKTRTKTTITLKWTKNTSADGYVIQQYKGGKWKTIKTITKNSTVNYKVTGLKKATTYKFRIKASNKDGNTKLYSSYTIKSIKTL